MHSSIIFKGKITNRDKMEHIISVRGKKNLFLVGTHRTVITSEGIFALVKRNPMLIPGENEVNKKETKKVVSKTTKEEEVKKELENSVEDNNFSIK